MMSFAVQPILILFISHSCEAVDNTLIQIALAKGPEIEEDLIECIGGYYGGRDLIKENTRMIELLDENVGLYKHWYVSLQGKNLRSCQLQRKIFPKYLDLSIHLSDNQLTEVSEQKIKFPNHIPILDLSNKICRLEKHKGAHIGFEE